MLALTLAVSLQLGASEARPEAWLVVTRRSGVARPQALDFARQLGAALNERGVPTPTPAEDATSCAAKVPCLVDLAQKKGVGVLIAVEAGSALDDVVLHVEALSIEEFGKKLATFDFTGPAKDFQAGLKDKVEEFFAPAVRNVLGLGTVAKAAAPPPVVAEKKPEAATPLPPAEEKKKVEPASIAVTQPGPQPRSGMSGLNYVGVGAMVAGGALLITSMVLGARAMSLTGQRRSLCRDGMPCNDPAAYRLYEQAGGSQNAGMVTLFTGLGLAAVGAVLFLVDFGGGSQRVDPGGAGENPQLGVAPVIAPGFAGVSISSRF